MGGKLLCLAGILPASSVFSGRGKTLFSKTCARKTATLWAMWERPKVFSRDLWERCGKPAGISMPFPQGGRGGIVHRVP